MAPRIEVVRRCFDEGYTVGVTFENGRIFYLDCSRFKPITERTALDFRHALAAHDAELDKTRFVELTEQVCDLQERNELLRTERAQINKKDADMWRALHAENHRLTEQYEDVCQLAAVRLECANKWLDKYYELRNKIRETVSVLP